MCADIFECVFVKYINLKVFKKLFCLNININIIIDINSDINVNINTNIDTQH